MNIGVKMMVGLMRLLALQPLKVHYFWGRLISSLVSSYRRDVVMINLARSFPEKKYRELVQIADAFYRHFGRIIAETVWFAGSYNSARLKKAHICEIENIEVLNGLYENTPGVVVLCSHFGNWEIMGGIMKYTCASPAPSFTENDLSVVYKQLKSKFWDKVFEYNRCAPLSGVDHSSCYVESRDIMRFVVSHREKKHIYCFPTDQCPYKYASAHKVNDFLHQPTTTMIGGAALAGMCGLSVCYMSMRENENGGYTMSFREICRDASTCTPEKIMNDFYRLLEEDVVSQPENYMWTHKRWKR